MQRALAGVTVLDLTHYIAGPFCTKLLADYGADVLKIERPGGDGARRLGPFPGDVPDPEKSALFLHLNTNKRSLVLNLKSRDGVEALKMLVWTADVLVESFHPRVRPSLGLGYDALKAINPVAGRGVDIRLRPDRAVSRLPRLRDRRLRVGRTVPGHGAGRPASPQARRQRRAIPGGRPCRRGHRDGASRPRRPRPGRARGHLHHADAGRQPRPAGADALGISAGGARPASTQSSCNLILASRCHSERSEESGAAGLLPQALYPTPRPGAARPRQPACGYRRAPAPRRTRRRRPRPAIGRLAAEARRRDRPPRRPTGRSRCPRFRAHGIQPGGVIVDDPARIRLLRLQRVLGAIGRAFSPPHAFLVPRSRFLVPSELSFILWPWPESARLGVEETMDIGIHLPSAVKGTTGANVLA